MLTDALEDVGNIFEIIKNFINSLFYTEEVVGTYKIGTGPEITVTKLVETPLKLWFDKVVNKVSTFITELPSNLVKAIGKVGDLFTTIIGIIFGSKKANDKTSKGKQTSKETEKQTDDAVSTWGATILNAIKKFIISIPDHIISIIKSVGDLGRKIINAVKEAFKPEQIADETQKDLEDSVDKISIASILETIKNIGKEIANQFLSWFTGTEDMDANFAWFTEKVSGWINGIPAALKSAIDWTTKELTGLWNGLYKSIVGQDKEGKPLDSNLKTELDKVTSEDGSLHIGLENIVDIIMAAFRDAGTMINTAWDNLINSITGKNGKELEPDKVLELESAKSKEELQRKVKEFQEQGYYVPGFSGFETFARKLGQAFASIFTDIPQWILDGLNSAVATIDEAFNYFTEHINESTEKMAEQSTEDSAENVEKTEPTPLQKSLETLGIKLRNLIFKTLPEFMATGFEWIKTKATGWKNALFGIFDGINTNAELQEKVNSIGESIAKWIREIPDKIRKAFTDIGNTIRGWLHPTERMVGIDWAEGIGLTYVTTDLDEAAENVEKDANQSTLLSTIQEVAGNIGSALAEAFNNIWPDGAGILAKLPTAIVNGLNAAFTAVGDAVKNAKDWFDTNLIGDAAAENAQGAIKEATEATAEGAEKAADDASQESGLITAITGLGSTIWKLITETIPGAIRSGFNWVKENWAKEGGWKDSLVKLFTGLPGLAGVEIDIESIKQKIIETIEKLPETIRAAWESAKELLAKIFTDNKTGLTGNLKRPKYQFMRMPTSGESILELVELDKSSVSDIQRTAKESSDKAADAISEGSEGSSLWDSLLNTGKEIGTIILDGLNWAFENIEPVLATGWNKFIEFISKIFNALIDFFGGKNLGDAMADQIDDTSKNSSALKSAFQTLGTAIETFITETIPKFIGKGLAWVLLHDIPSLINGFVEGIQEQLSKEDESTNKGAEGIIKGGLGFLTWIYEAIQNFVDLVTKDDGSLEGWAKVVLVVVGIVVLFATVVIPAINGFRDAFGKRKSDKAAEVAEAKNGPLAVVKAIINLMELFVILAGIASVVKKDQFDQMMQVLDVMGEFFDKLMPIITMLSVGWLADTGLEHFEDITKLFKKTEETASNANQDGERTVSLIDRLKETVFGGLIESLGGLFKGLEIGAIGVGASTAADSVSEVFSNVITNLLTNFERFGIVIGNFMTRIEKVFGDVNETLGKLETVLQIMTKAVEIAQKVVEIGNMYEDVKTGLTVIEEIGLSLQLLTTNFTSEFYINEFVDGMKRLNELIGIEGPIEQFVNWMHSSGSAFEEYKYALSVLSSILSFSDFAQFASVNTITDEQINGAFGILKKIIESQELGEILYTAANKMGDDVIESQQLSTSMESIIIMGSALSRLATAVSGFTTETTQNLVSFFDAISKLDAQAVDEYGDVKTGFAKHLLGLATGVSEFLTKVSDVKINVDNVDYAIVILNRIADVARALDDIGHGILAQVFVKGTDLAEFGIDLSSLGTNIQGFMEAMKPLADENGEFKENWNFENVVNALYVVEQVSKAAARLNKVDLSSFNTLIAIDKNGASTVAASIVKFVETFSISLAKLPGEVRVDPASVVNVINTFETLASGLGKLSAFMGTNSLTNTLEQLAYGAAYDGEKNVYYLSRNTDTAKKSLVGVATAIAEMYKEITLKMETVYNSNSGTLSGKKIIDIKKVKEFLSVINEFFIALSSFSVYDTYDTDWFTAYVVDMVAAFEYLTEHVQKLFDTINALGSYEDRLKLNRAQKVMTLLETITSMFRNLQGYTYNTQIIRGSGSGAASTIQQLAEQNTNIYDGMMQLLGFDFNDLTTVIDRFITAFDKSMDNPINQEHFKASGKSMATYLYQGIENAFNSDEGFHPVITPVLDAENFKTEMAALFGVEYTQDFNLGSALSTAVQNAFIQSSLNAPKDYTDLLNAIDGKIGTANDNLKTINQTDSNIVSAFAGAKIVIDNGALAWAIGPYVDKYLAEIGYLYLRHNTTDIANV